MKSFLLLITLFISVAASAQITASGAFTSAPGKIFPLLDTNTKLDMVDYYNSGLNTPSANRLDGRSVITDMTPGSISVKLSESSSAQIAVMTAGNDTIIALVSTVATPGLDSNLKFYDSNWNQLPASKFFTTPTWDDWMTSGHSAAEVMTYAPFMLASYFIDTEKGTLTATNNLSTLLDEETYASLTEALNSSLTYRWNGKRFTR